MEARYRPRTRLPYSPVVTLTTIRTILSVISSWDLELEQMDIATAFLNRDLHEDVHMPIPEGLNSDSNKNEVASSGNPFSD